MNKEIDIDTVIIDMLICSTVMERNWPQITKLSPDGFGALIGTMIDQYGADHDYTKELTMDFLKGLSAVQEEILTTDGMPLKRNLT